MDEKFKKIKRDVSHLSQEFERVSLPKPQNLKSMSYLVSLVEDQDEEIYKLRNALKDILENSESEATIREITHKALKME